MLHERRRKPSLRFSELKLNNVNYMSTTKKATPRKKPVRKRHEHPLCN